MKNSSRPKKQTAPPPPKIETMQLPTRRHSDTVLARALEEHMQESISDIAALYQKLTLRLGAKTMRYQEYIRASASLNVSDRGLHDTVSQIVQWRHACDKRKLKSETVMLIIADGMNFSSVAKRLRMNRHCVRAHVRACLAVWSLWRKRCDAREVQLQYDTFLTCCKLLIKPQSG